MSEMCGRPPCDYLKCTRLVALFWAIAVESNGESLLEYIVRATVIIILRLLECLIACKSTSMPQTPPIPFLQPYGHSHFSFGIVRTLAPTEFFSRIFHPAATQKAKKKISTTLHNHMKQRDNIIACACGQNLDGWWKQKCIFPVGMQQIESWLKTTNISPLGRWEFDCWEGVLWYNGRGEGAAMNADYFS